MRLAVIYEHTTAHSYSSSQFNITDNKILKIIKKLQSTIDKKDLTEEDGLETESHITVKYGLHINKAKELIKAVKDFGKVSIKFGDISLFKSDEHDVIKIEILGKDIRDLNKLITKSIECTTTHPTYKPHLTLAYVKPGCGDKYTGESGLKGVECTFDTLMFSNKFREKTPISLN